jgi:hypothetical protein
VRRCLGWLVQESAKCQLEQKVKWAHANSLQHLEQSQQLLAATGSRRAEKLQGWSEKQRVLNERSTSARQRCTEEREERLAWNHVAQEEGRRAGHLVHLSACVLACQSSCMAFACFPDGDGYTVQCFEIAGAQK